MADDNPSRLLCRLTGCEQARFHRTRPRRHHDRPGASVPVQPRSRARGACRRPGAARCRKQPRSSTWKRFSTAGRPPVLRSRRLPRAAGPPSTSRRSPLASKTRARASAASSGASTASPPRLRQATGQRSGLHRHPAAGTGPRRQHHRGARLQRQQPAGLLAGAHHHQVHRPAGPERSPSCISSPSASTPISTRDGRRRGRTSRVSTARPRGQGRQSLRRSMKKAAAGLYGEVRVTLALDKDATRDNLEKAIANIAREVASARFLHPVRRRPWHVRERPLLSHPAGLPERAGHISRDMPLARTACRTGSPTASRPGAPSSCSTPASRAHWLPAMPAHAQTRRPRRPPSAGCTRRPAVPCSLQLRPASSLTKVSSAPPASGTACSPGRCWTRCARATAMATALIELSELVRHVQSVVPKIAADMGGAGRAATAEPVWGQQAARFGSRGEDFAVAQRLQ